MRRKCGYCGTQSKKVAYRKLPNKLVCCIDCYQDKNPLFKFGTAKYMWDNRYDMRAGYAEEIERQGKPPRMDKVERAPIIKTAYKLLMKGRRVRV